MDVVLTMESLCAAFAGLGAAASLTGALATRRFTARPPPAPPATLPPVTLLKPLCGDEPLLAEALESAFRQDYPSLQIVFGVQGAADPALATVQDLQARFPGLDVTIVANPALHGPNRKVSNLINMLPAARHDVLVFSDSDLHAPPGYLRHLVASLAQPGVGLVTTLTTGRAANRSLAARLGCMQVSHGFLPAVLLSRWLGRQDGLGTTMALHRRTLQRAGGLAALAGHLADDHVLGRRVRALGLAVALAAVIPATTVPETRLAALWAHELRWGRTMAALAPLPCLAATLQHGLAWAALALLLSGGQPRMAALFAAVWLARAAGLLVCAMALPGGPESRQDALRAACLLPVRDALSIAIAAASFCGRRVHWRGHVLHADDGDGAGRPIAAPGCIATLQEESRP